MGWGKCGSLSGEQKRDMAKGRRSEHREDERMSVASGEERTSQTIRSDRIRGRETASKSDGESAPKRKSTRTDSRDRSHEKPPSGGQISQSRGGRRGRGL